MALVFATVMLFVLAKLWVGRYDSYSPEERKRRIKRQLRGKGPR